MSLRLDYPTLRVFLDGMLMMMACYALLSFLWHYKRLYLYYGLYILGMIANLYFNDLAHYLIDLNGDEQAVNQAATLEVSIQSIAFIFYTFFARQLLDLQNTDTFSYRLTQWLIGLFVVRLLLDIGLAYYLPGLEADIQRLLYLIQYFSAGLCTFWIIFRIVRLRHAVASLFLVGTGLFVAGALTAVIMNLTAGADARQPALPFSFPLLPMQIGIVLEMLCYTMSIALLNRQTEQDKLIAQSQLIEQLQENERKQARLNGLRDEIARDLHDEMGSQLSSISILSQTTSRYVSDERARHRLVTIGQTARQVMESMREIVWSLNSSSDTLMHVGLRIRETAYTLFNDSSIQLHTDLTGVDALHELTQKQRRELHLIVKECLTNILRHANAQNVWFILRVEPDRLVCTIRDDGVGFDLTTQASGLGLRSIRSRAGQMGATLSIESESGMGTTIQVNCLTVNGLNNPIRQQLESSTLQQAS